MKTLLALLLVALVGCGGPDFGYAPTAPAGATGGDSALDNWVDTAGTGGSTPDADLPDNAPDNWVDKDADIGSDAAGMGGSVGAGGVAGSGGAPVGGAGGSADGGSSGAAGDAGSGSGGGSSGGAGGLGGGTGGSGGGPTCSTACGPHETCYAPLQICVASMVTTPASFAIDSTEVTRGQYDSWLAAEPPLAMQPSFCAWNVDYAPDLAGMNCQLNMAPDSPVTCVDWCDAAAYCNAVGKRLCGQIGGGQANYDAPNDPQAQWYSACAQGSDCVVNVSAPESVASRGTCKTVDDAFDMVGNVQEWIDGCQSQNGLADRCRFLGGAYSWATASCDSYNYLARSDQMHNLGFRCCSDP